MFDRRLNNEPRSTMAEQGNH